VLSEQNHLLEQARAAIEECLAIDPRDDQARYFSAVLDRRENKLEQAERRLRELIASAPKHPYVRYACRYELAQVLDRTDRFEEAMGLLAEAKQIVGGLTDTGLLLRGYDQAADRARCFTQSLPRTRNSSACSGTMTRRGFTKRAGRNSFTRLPTKPRVHE
jgi:tetratricopeptide (TPR) repeat protein